jgi:hypothetical protein
MAVRSRLVSATVRRGRQRPAARQSSVSIQRVWTLKPQPHKVGLIQHGLVERQHRSHALDLELGQRTRARARACSTWPR